MRMPGGSRHAGTQRRSGTAPARAEPRHPSGPEVGQRPLGTSAGYAEPADQAVFSTLTHRGAIATIDVRGHEKWL